MRLTTKILACLLAITISFTAVLGYRDHQKSQNVYQAEKNANSAVAQNSIANNSETTTDIVQKGKDLVVTNTAEPNNTATKNSAQENTGFFEKLAYKFSNTEEGRRYGTILWETLEGLLNVWRVFAPQPSDWTVKAKYQKDNFYQGHTKFLSEPAEDAVWSLGYSQRSLLEDGFSNFSSKIYYMGGYFSFPAKKITRNLDDMKVRTIVLEDGSGRGKVAYAVIDAIGLSNADVREIRNRLAEFASQHNMISINVAVTHSHSNVDTQGLNGSLLTTMIKNPIVALKSGKDFASGRDPAFMENLFVKTAESIQEAYLNMQEGKLYYSKKNISSYLMDKRAPTAYMKDLYRLRFVPFDSNYSETYILNFSAHPETTGLTTDENPGNEQTSDFVYYMEQEINKAGHNMIFIQGALGGLISCSRNFTNDGLDLNKIGELYGESARHQETKRWGAEIGKIALAMTMDKQTAIREVVDLEQEAAEQQYVTDPQRYTRWYSNWTKVTETEVEPILNISHKEITLPIDNGFVGLALKLKIFSNTVLYSGTNLYVVTEVGYMEIGKNLKAAFIPGELFPEIAIGGGALLAEHAFKGVACEYPPMNTMVEGELLVFGLANDAVGYIVPENDFGNVFVGNYEELMSFSSASAPRLVRAFQELAQNGERF